MDRQTLDKLIHLCMYVYMYVCVYIYIHTYTGLLSNQGEKSINFYFIMVPLKEKSIKVWYSKAQYTLTL